MKYDIVPEACRICLRKSPTCRSIFDPLPGDDTAPNIKLNLLSGLNVTGKDEIKGIPKCICKKCEIAVNMAFNLRKRARKSEQILSVYCNNINKDNIIVELSNGRKFKLSKELTLKVIPKNNSTIVRNTLSNFQGNLNFEQIQLNEMTINACTSTSTAINKDVVKDLENAQDNESDNDDDSDEDDEQEDETYDDLEEPEISISDSDEKHDIENEQEMPDSDEKNDIGNEQEMPVETVVENTEGDELKKPPKQTQPPPAYNIEEIAEKIKASKQYELVSWKHNDDPNSVPTIKLRIKDPPEKPLSKDFICDVCGNTYTQKHRLMDHMRRHNPEKLFACEFCDKRFAVPEGLRRHVLTHGGLKPFKCHFCNRCFYTPSARKAHEKVHNGHKPYKCKICSYSFAYSSSLTKHKLIHENKKLYRCEYCDKDFRLQHHMKQHEETQIHKDAVAKCKLDANQGHGLKTKF